MCLCKWTRLFQTCCKCKAAWEKPLLWHKNLGKKKRGEFCEFMTMNRYIIKLPFIFSWCLSHTRADTHDCTLTFWRSNKVLFLQLASAKLNGEERCLILVRTNPMRCNTGNSAHMQHRCSTASLSHTQSSFCCGSAIVFISLLLELAHCFGKAFREEVSIFRKSMCHTFVSPFSLVDQFAFYPSTLHEGCSQMREYVQRLSAWAQRNRCRHTEINTQTQQGPTQTSPSRRTGGTCSSLGKVTHSSSYSLTDSASLSCSHSLFLSVIFISPKAAQAA